MEQVSKLVSYILGHFGFWLWQYASMLIGIGRQIWKTKAAKCNRFLVCSYFFMTFHLFGSIWRVYSLLNFRSTNSIFFPYYIMGVDPMVYPPPFPFLSIINISCHWLVEFFSILMVQCFGVLQLLVHFLFCFLYVLFPFWSLAILYAILVLLQRMRTELLSWKMVYLLEAGKLVSNMLCSVLHLSNVDQKRIKVDMTPFCFLIFKFYVIVLLLAFRRAWAGSHFQWCC